MISANQSATQVNEEYIITLSNGADGGGSAEYNVKINSGPAGTGKVTIKINYVDGN